MKNLSTYVVLAAVISIIILSVAVKIVAINDPFVGSHLFRQLQTVSTIEAYQIDGINLLQPRTNYIGYPGNMLLELPIFQAISATISGKTGSALLTTRCFNLLLGLASAILLFRISRLYVSRYASLASVVFFLTAPLNLMYHWSTLPDISAIFFTLVATFYYLSHLKSGKLSKLQLGVFLGASCITLLIKPLYYFPISCFVIADLAYELAHRSNRFPLQYIKQQKSVWIAIVIGGLVMIAWLMTSAKLSTAQDVSSHLGWTVMKTPGFYVSMTLRYFFYIQNPLTILLSILGLLFISNKRTLYTVAFVCFLLPFAYYLSFANINRPHDYYSLILVPFSAIVAGFGVNWIQDHAPKNIWKPCLIIALLFCTATLSFFLYLGNYWITPNTRNRYRELNQMTKEILEPYQYSIVWVDRQGNFEINEYLGESRRDMISAKLGRLNESKLRSQIRPIYEPAVLYALNHQYGEMNWYTGQVDKLTLSDKIDSYEGHLKYIIFYLPTTQPSAIEQLGWSNIFESKELLIYEMPSSD